MNIVLAALVLGLALLIVAIVALLIVGFNGDTISAALGASGACLGASAILRSKKKG